MLDSIHSEQEKEEEDGWKVHGPPERNLGPGECYIRRSEPGTAIASE